ncbi:Peptidyl prolyl cis trans isomerase-like [Zostera marina]|uniref:Peptidyl prolyl cis trans isomerase-like n=1 Tax=Zostera marina TaxID=29655 RepID=A0A0K9NSH0_ZOSMR|nr:Peptidyl prolyl cis trans isomerase-like [Zostera marina]
MSSVYVVEPPTKGKVVINTNMGPLDIELWPKEAPKATRNFVQLCLDGYYNRTIFHRIIKSFLIQGGDPTGTGTGGESIYGGVFADEYHSRLRFTHRGLVACANAGTPHSNGSQFFITLDRCDWLDKKNTIFGKVTGDSIFNVLRIGEVETDKDDRPVDQKPKILSVEVLWNPFDDMVPRQVRKEPSPSQKIEIQDQKKKTVKKLNLLSFGEEAEEEEKVLATVKDKIRSIHDELDDPRFPKEELEKKSLPKDDVKKDIHITVREALNTKKGEFDRTRDKDHSKSRYSDDDNNIDDDDGSSFDARMRMQILKKRQERGDVITREKPQKEKHNAKNAQLPSLRETVKDDDEDDNKIEKLSMKKKGVGSELRAKRMVNTDVDLQLLGHAEQERQMIKHKKRRLGGREEETLARLNKFKGKFSAMITTSEDGKEDENVSGWMKNDLKFTPEPSNKGGMTRNEDPNDYVVLDPLLEKGKEKFNKMQAKAKRRRREWAGNSIT